MNHAYDPGRYNRCKVQVQTGRDLTTECGQYQDHTWHRTYPCPVDGKRFPSIEMRDKHKANAHGGGW